MKKVMYFGATVSAFPCENVVGYDCASTSVTIWYDLPNNEPAAATDVVSAKAVVACAAGKAGEVLEQLYDEINYGQSSLVDVLALKAVTSITSSAIDQDQAS